jgi:S1-C subfamily serine protease
MGEMIDIEAELVKDNPKVRAIDLRVFADALRSYTEASENIRRNGVIVSHPRTGAPIENPYLKAQKQTGDILTKMRAVKADRVLEMLAEDLADKPESA